MLVIGSCFAIYIAFTQRELNSFVKYAVKFFFPIVNVALAIAIGIYVMQNPTLLNKLLASWQFLQAAAFFLFTGHDNVGDFYEMPKRHARRNEIIVATLIVVLLIAWSVWELWYWAVTFPVVLLVWRVVGGFFSEYEPLRSFLLKSPVLGARRKCS